jgi:hypothetical protein
MVEQKRVETAIIFRRNGTSQAVLSALNNPDAVEALIQGSSDGHVGGSTPESRAAIVKIRREIGASQENR